MFSHVMVGSNDIDRSKKFYDALFVAMGGKPGIQDAKGRLIKGGTNRRLTSIPPQVPAQTATIAAAVGRAKVPAIKAALAGRLINGLITDEATARAVLD